MLKDDCNDPQNYRRTLMIYGGEARDAFTHLAKKICTRSLAQTGTGAIPDNVLTHFAQTLWVLLKTKPRPAPLTGTEQGAAGEIPPEELAALERQLFAAFKFPAHVAALRPLAQAFLETLYLPEFKQCRLSYKEANAAGACERQSLAAVLQRPSGSHCVDCPYWIALTPEKNEKLLTKEWPAAQLAEFQTNVGVFLPEDFRALRRFLHMHARFGKA